MPRHRNAPRPDAEEPFVFLHVGDLHVDRDPARPPAQATQIVTDLHAILADIASIADANLFDFVYLPGDLAENGCANEYDAIRAVLDHHPPLPVRLIPGDHDRQTGTMTDFAAFYAAAMAGVNTPVRHDLPTPPTSCPPREGSRTLEQFYFHEDVGDVRCLFVDMVSAGYGQKGVGLDFRLGAEQTRWLRKKIVKARARGMRCAVFMHAYPADCRDAEEGAALAGLFWNEGVSLVEMGHTHYNELSPDGRTLYAAARSVGQNEDGPAGYAVGAIDRGVVSWRFKQLQLPWPFVMITSPADRRLATAPLSLAGRRMPVRALVLSDRPARVACQCRVDDGRWIRMTRTGPRRFAADVEWPPGSRRLTVEAQDGRAFGHDYVDQDVIEPPPTSPDFVPARRPDRPGSDAARLGAWPGKGLRADQLGPNRAGRKW